MDLDSKNQELEASVTSVILMEDRAQIRREGSIELDPGLHCLVVKGVSPVIHDRTLSAVARGPGGVVVTECFVERHARVARDERPERVAKAESEIRTLMEEDRDLQETIEDGDGRARGIEALAVQTYSDIASDVSWGRPLERDLLDSVTDLEGRRLDFELRRARVQVQRDRLAERVSNMEDWLGSIHGPDQDMSAILKLFVQVESRSVVLLSVSYVVPGAYWRPQYFAHLDGGRLEMKSRAVAWQNTGESFDEVTLQFSTQRTTKSVSPPILVDDFVLMEPKPDELIVTERDEEIQATGGGTAGGTASRDVPGVDDGGTVQQFTAPGRVTLPSDGQPHFFDLHSWEAPAETRRVLVPEMARMACVVSHQNNGGIHPILAGPVHLIRDSGYVGRTSVLFVAPGEAFRLGWGGDPEIRVQRSPEVKEEVPGVLSSWSKSHYTVRLALSNIGTQTKTLRIQERIPVSEVESVAVDFDARGTTGDPRPPDENGIVEWCLDLPPHGPRRLVLKYVVRKKRNVQQA